MTTIARTGMARAAAATGVVAAWLLFARFAGEPLVRAAHAGSLPGQWGFVLHARLHHPLGHYLGLWRQYAAAVALGITAWSFLTAPRASVRQFPRPGFPLFAALFLGLTVFSGPRHDYVAYLEIWRLVSAGDDPWSVHPELGYALNAYGPLFNLMAPLSLMNPLLPKILFAYAYLGMLRWCSEANPSNATNDAWRTVRWLGLLGPYFWVEIALYGHFDILVGLCCLAATRSVSAGRPAAGGFALAAGILLKYLPVLLAPALGLACRFRLRRFLALVAALTVAGLAIAYAVWGPSTARPWLFADRRASTFASIFRFLRGRHGPPIDLDHASLPALLLALLVVCLLTWRLKLSPSLAATLSALCAVAFYRVGFLQYHVTAVLLLCNLNSVGPRARFWAASYLTWISCLNLVVAHEGGVLHPGDRLFWLDDVAGLPTFVIELGLMVSLAADATARAEPLRPQIGAGPAPLD